MAFVLRVIGAQAFQPAIAIEAAASLSDLYQPRPDRRSRRVDRDGACCFERAMARLLCALSPPASFPMASVPGRRQAATWQLLRSSHPSEDATADYDAKAPAATMQATLPFVSRAYCPFFNNGVLISATRHPRRVITLLASWSRNLLPDRPQTAAAIGVSHEVCRCAKIPTGCSLWDCAST